MTNTPLVSIVIPCYNSERYIGEAIESALGQTYPNIEVIVIDDGSTDDSASIIQRFLPRIKFVRQPNRGACAARNVGLCLAEGPFVKFHDADDLMFRTAIAAQLSREAQLARVPNAILFGDVVTGDEKANVLPGKNKDRCFNAGDTASLADVFDKAIFTHAPLHKRSLLTEIGRFNVNIKISQDYELAIRMAIHGVRFIYYPDQCAIHRNYTSKFRVGSNAHIYDYVNLVDSIAQLPKPAAISTQIDRHVARKYWGVGRRALRLGFPDVADACFRKARSNYASDPICGSAPYRLLASMCGPDATERVAESAKRLVSRMRRQLTLDSACEEQAPRHHQSLPRDQ